MLNAVDFKMKNVAYPRLTRAATRPKSSPSVLSVSVSLLLYVSRSNEPKHFARISDTKEMLSRGRRHHDAYLHNEPQSTETPRDRFLARLRSVDASASAGHRTIINVESVADVFGMLLMVHIRSQGAFQPLTSVQGDTTFSPKAWHKFYLRSVPCITRGVD